MLNSGNDFSGGNRSSEWRNQIFANRYYLRLWTESKPCCGFRTGKLTTYFQCKLSPNQGITKELYLMKAKYSTRFGGLVLKITKGSSLTV